MPITLRDETAAPGDGIHRRADHADGRTTAAEQGNLAAFRKRLYDSVDALQADLDQWLHHYNTERTHQGKMCCGRTPFQTMIEGKEIWKEKFVN